MEQSLKQNLLNCADAFVAKRKVKLTTLGRMVANDSPFFARLREDNKSSFTARKYDEIMRWFSDHWPAGADWPRSVPRPLNATSISSRGGTAARDAAPSQRPTSENSQPQQPGAGLPDAVGASSRDRGFSSLSSDSHAAPKGAVVS